MSSTGKQIVTIDILPNMARSKANHTLKFENIIWDLFAFKNHAEN